MQETFSDEKYYLSLYRSTRLDLRKYSLESQKRLGSPLLLLLL